MARTYSTMRVDEQTLRPSLNGLPQGAVVVSVVPRLDYFIVVYYVDAIV